MAFSSLFFMFLFLPLCIGIYFLANSKYRNAVLIAFSLIFYAWGDPVYIWLLLLVSCLNYLFGKMISFGNGGTPKFGLAIGLIMNIGLLISIKYTGFFIENINSIFNSGFAVPKMHLPLGLSFFTFRAISYLVDCHWGKIKAEKSFNTFLLYMTLFPITAQGPIVRYQTIALSLHSRDTSVVDFSEGMGRIVIGLAKKVLIADNLGSIVDQFLGSGSIENQSVMGAWYGVLMFALQIYFDFSGYSDMAIGIGRIFGFKFDENFRYPFLCKDVTEFWQRWHISLGTFFRDYVLYIPIFGKRRKFGGLFLVWLCTGLWHGASWNFLIWGLYYGAFLAIEMIIGKKTMKKIPAAVRHIYNKIVIIVGFCIFYFTNLSELGLCLKSMFFMGSGSFTDPLFVSSFKSNAILIAAAVIGCFPIFENIKKRIAALKDENTYMSIQVIGTLFYVALLIISGIFLVNATNRPFLYLKF
ncbi:MAG: MBOAT family protein [Ruminococcus sp.]|nr:MBOAT family protein [Ruminococcus sp.]